MEKKFAYVALGLSLVLGLSIKLAWSGPASQMGSKPVDSVVSLDGNGHELHNQQNSDKGYKVFTSTSSGIQIVTDETGGQALRGIIHQVCISSPSLAMANNTLEYAQVFDSSSTTKAYIDANGSTNTLTLGNFVGNELALVVAVSSQTTCQLVDAEFTKGLVFGHPSNHGGASWVYWTPNGRRN